MRTIVLSVLFAATLVAQPGRDAPDLAMYARIRDEGLARSQVMRYASELADGIGPRLTGSRSLERAMEWALARMTEVGGTNARRESWGEFGMGWESRNVWVRMVEPYPSNFIAAAIPWSPSTRGRITGPVTHVQGLNDDKGFEVLKGRLRDKIVLLGRAPNPPQAFPIEKPLTERLDDRALQELAQAQPAPRNANTQELERAFAGAAFAERIGQFFADEGVRAVMVPSGNNERGGASGGTIYVDWNYGLGMYAYQRSRAMRVPIVVLAVEDYLRIERLLARGTPVTTELQIDVEFTGDRIQGFNGFADIPGVDPKLKDEIVLVGGHLDSWAVGTGATDNAAGVAVVIEAMRILNALKIKPARTIRMAMWTGEEQGLLGSTAYVRQHVADVPRANSPAQLAMPESIRTVTGPVVPKGEHARLSAVYNIDGGAGRSRGVGVSGNAALVPIFQQWIEPLKDLGVAVVTQRSSCLSDCKPFADAGIPAPILVQDPLEFETRTHHTNADTYERLIEADLKQAAVVVATLLYNTAMRSERLPRQ